jgi:heptaprenylglyceryl phosphate synthase
MDFKLVSKNNLGVVTSLLLVILLSQSKFFNFLLDTALGRAILILFILFISYTNKILGVVSVLFIIIMFNSSDIGYMEGFTAPSSSNSNDSSTTNNTTNTSTTSNDSSSTSSTTPTLTDEQKQEIIAKLQEKTKDNSTTTSSSSVASEGFDIIGTENTIKRGKQSNSIPVNSFMKNSDDIMPFGGSFSDSYSAF